MMDISNLNIQINIKSQILSPNVGYGVYFVFKFCEPRRVPSKRMYVNLQYKKDDETLHAYFATWSDKDWMSIELCRFLHQKGDTDFDVLIESFSRPYCGSGAIYVEGIEFRAIDNVDEEKQVQQANDMKLKIDQLQQRSSEEKIFENDNELFSLSDVDGKKHIKLSLKKALYSPSHVELFQSKPAVHSRSPKMIELLPRQVFGIKYDFESRMLSPFTNYACYLVFTLSEKCRGMYCPVIVRDSLHWNKRETNIIYFRSPSPWNRLNANWVPKQRKDGWMEVMVCKFNSKFDLKKNRIPMKLKLITYEGTMAGLILCGLEVRPM